MALNLEGWCVVLDSGNAEQQQMAHLDFHVEDVEDGVKYENRGNSGFNIE